MEHRQIRALMIVAVRYGKNGVTSIVKSYTGRIDPSEVAFDYVLINEPDAAERREIEERGGKIFVLNRNRHPFAYQKRLAEICREGKYDLVHAHGNSATLYAEMHSAKEGGVPVRIAHSHNTRTNYPLIHNWLFSRFQRDTTHCLACGEAAGKWLFGDRPFTVLKNAIDTERFTFTKADRDAARARMKAENLRLYAHVGALVPAKNHAYLIDAFSNIYFKDPSARLILAGDGPLREELKKRVYAERIQGRVLFLGDKTDVKDVYAAADVFLLPSKNEGLPLSLLEAQCMGLPCLASDAVTEEANVLGLVRYQKLSDGMDCFAKTARSIPKRSVEERKLDAERLKNAGWDIRARAGELTEFYRAAMGMSAE